MLVAKWNSSLLEDLFSLRRDQGVEASNKKEFNAFYVGISNISPRGRWTYAVGSRALSAAS
jgi:hypothetical protein